jgi:hypothetical protein
MIVWQGSSMLTGEPIMVLASVSRRLRKGKAVSSGNSKTGEMIQLYIPRSDMTPLDALAQGKDEAICGVCPHRGKASGGSGACYVQVGKGPTMTAGAHFRKGSAPFDRERFRGQKVRFGAYGDPAAVLFEV